MTPEQKRLPELADEPQELTDEQWEAGRKIAKFCNISEEVLEQNMLWKGEVATIATVKYGLAHSAHHMQDLTATEIRTAILNGIADYQALGTPDGTP
jgi:hypothetical protein